MHAVKYDGDYKLSYMIGIDIDDLLIKDLSGDSVRDEDTGKFSLGRLGESMHTFENTITHELFHAFMDDYNRTGMLGVTKVGDYVFDNNGNLTSDAQRYYKLHLPTWLIEGSASAVENVYQFRSDYFDALRTGPDGKVKDSFAASMIVECYLNGTYDGKPAYFDLANCDASVESNGVGHTASAYVSGYLATLYLADLANIKSTGTSAIILKDNSVDNVSTEKLRMGLNSILERMHKGETLDGIIADISPANSSGKKLYGDTADFQKKFIKGTPTELPSGVLEYAAEGDEGSSNFVMDYLNYLNYVSNLPDRNYKANGSILLPVDVDTGSPINSTKQASSEYYKITESNKVVPSTVPDSVAFAGGGKSNPGDSARAMSSEPDESLAAQPLEQTVQGDGAEAESGNDAAPLTTEGQSLSDQAPENDSGVENAPEPTEEVAQGAKGE